MALSAGPSSTSDANAVTVLTISSEDKASLAHFAIINDGTADGFFSLDGGVTFRFLPGGSGRTMDYVKGMLGVIQIKRLAASNLSKVHIDVW